MHFAQFPFSVHTKKHDDGEYACVTMVSTVAEHTAQLMAFNYVLDPVSEIKKL